MFPQSCGEVNMKELLQMYKLKEKLMSFLFLLLFSSYINKDEESTLKDS